MSNGRYFSEEYLAQVSRPTVDLMLDALSDGAYERCTSLSEQLHGEVCAMLSGYLSWPKVISRNVETLYGASVWQEMDVAARRSLVAKPPPAKQVFAQWEVYKASIVEAADERDIASVEVACRNWQAHALAVHDAYMNYCAILVSELARRFRPDVMQQILTEIMNIDAMGIRPDMPFRQRVKALIRFTRLHLLPFELVEDDEKMTFICNPCPSGGRQVLAGLYEPGGPGEVIKGRSPMTYNRKEIPAYCCHESALEAASIVHFGAPIFVVDPAVQLGHQPCHVYIYKTPEKIPDQFYRRLGLVKNDDLIARG